ncbi:MAG: double-strand break repair helicase AddA [Pseudomonadota bacterium]
MAEAPMPEQRLAADPARSAWVGANAGSGKTRVLTHRVARLLLAGSRPERILCLTYTKAAAAEMQSRLFEMLGGWSMAEDATLAADLAALTGGAAPGGDRLAEARRLFAEALETPGGLRIQTIHAFCEQLLRRFPLEAAVSPRFAVADDRRADALAETVTRAQGAAASAAGEGVIDRIAQALGEDALGSLQNAIAAARTQFPATPAEIEPRLAAHFPTGALEGEAAAIAEALDRLDWPGIAGLATDLAAQPGKNGQTVAAQMQNALIAQRDGNADAALTALIRAFLTDTSSAGYQPKKGSWAVSKSTEEALPGSRDRYDTAATAVQEGIVTAACARLAARTGDLNAFAVDWLARYAAAKSAGGLLDFDDLVRRAQGLLAAPGLAPWVLWKLDGGIDHILVDEAQDTAPAQWDVIGALAEEFLAGQGVRTDRPRTVFAVGDEKQSIYSFQGADPQVFGARRAAFRETLAGQGGLAEPALERSFRSAPGILAFVDRVFEGPAGRGLVQDGSAPRHEAHHSAAPAQIDLWEPVLGEKVERDEEWWSPVNLPWPGNAKLRLADLLAQEIARMCAEDMLPGRDGGPGKPLGPGDVLVLVRRRDLLARALVRRLKTLGVPVAGADRILLTAELAVQDLLAALRVAALPDDDHALATLLRSPLCDVSEDGLFALAHARPPGERLSARLEATAAAHPRAAGLVRDLIARADFLRPYELLERILVRHEGRARLIARLGAEAEDAIDELLIQALAFEAEAVPSLAGFLAWLERGAVEVKRRPGRDAGAVRVMTVHGAKGLESPVVILPDTLGEPGGGGRQGPTLLPLPGGGNRPPLMLWAEGSAKRDDPLAAGARKAERARQTAEHKRLLYVALTRAETRLLIAAAGDPGKGEDAADETADPGAPAAAKAAVWYRMLSAAMDRSPDARPLPGGEAPSGAIPGLRRLGSDPVSRSHASATASSSDPKLALKLPSWAAKSPAEPRRQRLTPSSLAPEEIDDSAEDHPTIGPTATTEPVRRDREAARRHGVAVHRLLEHLPALPAAERDTAAARVLAGLGLDPTAAAALREAQGVLKAPFAAEIFGPGSYAEVSLGGTLAPMEEPTGASTPPLFLGRIDRLIVSRERVLAVDFKTDAAVPPAGTPPGGYLAQLGAYAAGLARLYPNRSIALAILWTALPRLDPIPRAAAAEAFAHAANQPAKGTA